MPNPSFQFTANGRTAGHSYPAHTKKHMRVFLKRMLTYYFLPMCISTLLFAVCTSVPALSDTYAYHPLSPLKLGNGIKPLEPLNAIPTCITGEERKVENVAVLTTFDTNLIKERRDLYSTLNISGSTSGRYEFMTGNGTIDIENQHSFSSNDVHWYVKAYSDYGRKDIPYPALLKSAQNLIDTKQYAEFARQCGTEVVLQERRAATIIAIFSLHTIDEAEKTRIEQSFKSGATLEIWDAAVAESYKSFVSQATKVSRINVSVYAIGGEGIQKLDLGITESTDLKKISEMLKAYAKGFSFETAAPSYYYSGSMERFGWQGIAPDASAVNIFLADLYFILKDVQQTKSRLKDIVSTDLGTPYGQLIGTDGIKKYNELISKYVDTTQAIYAKGRECAKNQIACKSIKDVIPEPISWPTLPPLLINIKTTKVTHRSESRVIFGQPFTYYWDLVAFDGVLTTDFRFIAEFVSSLDGYANLEYVRIDPQLDDIKVEIPKDLPGGLALNNELLNMQLVQRKFYIEKFVPIRCDPADVLPFGFCPVANEVDLSLRDKFNRVVFKRIWHHRDD